MNKCDEPVGLKNELPPQTDDWEKTKISKLQRILYLRESFPSTQVQVETEADTITQDIIR